MGNLASSDGLWESSSEPLERCEHPAAATLPRVTVSQVYDANIPETETVSRFGLKMYQYLGRHGLLGELTGDVALIDCVGAASAYVEDATPNSSKLITNLKEYGDKDIWFMIQLNHIDQTESIRKIYKEDSRWRWIDDSDLCTFAEDKDYTLYAKLPGSDSELFVNVLKFPVVASTARMYPKNTLFPRVVSEEDIGLPTEQVDLARKHMKSLKKYRKMSMNLWHAKYGFDWIQHDMAPLSETQQKCFDAAVCLYLKYEDDKSKETEDFYGSGYLAQHNGVYGVVTCHHMCAPKVERISVEKRRKITGQLVQFVNEYHYDRIDPSIASFDPTHTICGLQFTNAQYPGLRGWVTLDHNRVTYMNSRNFADGVAFVPFTDQTNHTKYGHFMKLNEKFNCDDYQVSRVIISGYPQSLKEPWFSILRNDTKSVLLGAMEMATAASDPKHLLNFGIYHPESIGISQLFVCGGLSGSSVCLEGKEKHNSIPIGTVAGGITLSINNSPRDVDVILLHNSEEVCNELNINQIEMNEALKKLLPNTLKFRRIQNDSVDLPIDYVARSMAKFAAQVSVGCIGVVGVCGVGYKAYQIFSKQ